MKKKFANYLPGAHHLMIPVLLMILIAFCGLPASAGAEHAGIAQKKAFKSSAKAGAYWTEERMKEAMPLPLPKLDRDTGEMGSGEIDAAGGATPWVYTSYQLTPDLVQLYEQPPYRSIGKLFFTIGKVPHVCSGSVVNAPNMDLVWTAGHCVYSPGDGWHDNFLFVPARHKGVDPYESWTYRAAFTLVGWQNGLWEYDMGALVMDIGGPQGNYHVGELGGLNFIANIDRFQHFHVKGYPAEPPFDGEHHHTCASPWVTNDQLGGTPGIDPKTVGIGCDMTGGSSGSPWIVNLFSDNYLNGNVSYAYGGVPDQIYGPYFGDAAQNLYDFASTY